ncbi:hypothetical protein LTR10_023478 [Elasticomyces elasticus]|uniref:Major facilitator superfamily (MFS) profile domain-containing protein n=1 Tax=Exophiala sideris TaxID=1016849 RepID=A0ABR0J6S2_9EURO|nr:hypothetical protein LTR10_023478 [Elasticomyces elasticus]KAK5028813.1 hypothetical protein LTS07_006192 [Exophiala sideris]KAK5035682.1 hypothetical protein LTR13_005811 [Exophiala sideris]KAK5057317.1 hypothetical protein LTR69_007356 [Exophiala sideris]KAK5181710.1 hypothetical protein LTR44_005910 [Eurotiomycetes sp. CCFEE 6388]
MQSYLQDFPPPTVSNDAQTTNWDGDNDPENPQNWPAWKKACTCAIISLIAYIVGFASSIDSAVIPQASRRFHVSDVSESLATTLFLVGFGCGAPFAGPLSETYGRNPIYLTNFALFSCWILGAALAPNYGAQLVFRFLAGVCGSTPFTTAGGTLADIFNHHTRFKIFPFFALCGFLGPMTGPMVGGWIGQSGIDWRWADWVTLCICGGIFALIVFFLPETYAPVILKWKAQSLHVGSHTTVQGPVKESLRAKLATALSRPFIILSTEPIVAIWSGYLTLIYAVAFCFFSSVPYIFGDTYGFSQGPSYMMFVSVSVGLVICAFATPLFAILVGREFAAAAAQGKPSAGPEAVLWWALIGGPFLPISLLWMAWSARSSVSYWSPMMSAAFFGFSILCVFISTYAYLMQRYAKVAASALVGITLIRYICGGTMVIVAIPMFENLGVHHALTIFAAISCAFTPLPYILYFRAKKQRNAEERL